MLAPPPTSSGLLTLRSSTSGRFLAPPPTSGASASQGQGSIAPHAMRSLRSLARMGSWAQFSGAMEEDGKGSKTDGTAKDKAKKKGDGTVGKKEGRDKKTKSKTPKVEVTVPRNPKNRHQSHPSPKLANSRILHKHKRKLKRRRRRVCRCQISRWAR